MSRIPKDPVMLLSYLNTQLRDIYPSLEELCDDQQIPLAETVQIMAAINYHYQADQNQFK